MPLLKPTYQPFYSDPDSPAVKACNGTFCYPVASGDIVRQQYTQTPCNSNLVCDPTFNDFSLGAEMITNGSFTTNADDWFVDGVEIASTACPALVNGWCYDGVEQNIGHDGTGGNTDPVEQTGIGLSAGNRYLLNYTVSGVGQGWIVPILGDGTDLSIGEIVQASGDYEEMFFYNDVDDVIQFATSEDFDGSITDISLVPVTMECWTGDSWVFEGSSACTVTNGAGNLINNAASSYISNGDYYVVTFHVDSVFAGSISLYIDDGTDTTQTNLQAAVSSPGTYTYYITALQDGVIAFEPSALFQGCISSPTVHRLRQDYPFQLIDPAVDSIDVSEFATYVNDKVLLNIDFAALLEAGVIADYGCYNIHVTDSCLVSGDNLVADGDFANGDYSDWTRNNGQYQFDMTTGYIEFIYEPLEGSNLVSNGDFASGTTGWTGFGASWTESGDATHVVGNTTALSTTLTITPPPLLPSVMKYYVQFTMSGRTAGSLNVQLSDGTVRTFSTNGVITFEATSVATGGSVSLVFTPTSNFDGTIDDVAVHETENIWSPYPFITNTINTSIVAGNYEAEFEITQITGGSPIGAASYLVGQLISIVFEDTVAVHTTSIPGYVPGAQRVAVVSKFEEGGILYPGRVRVDNVSLVRVEPFEATYVSECLNFQESHTDTTLVTGWCDQNAFDLDFENTDYVLQMRIECRSLNPVHPKEAVVAKFSTGDGSLKYAQLEKYWQFVTGYLSESALTTLAAMSSCDHFTIGEAGVEATEYIAEVEDFIPQWRAAGDYDLAPAILNIRKKEGGMKFNRHT